MTSLTNSIIVFVFFKLLLAATLLNASTSNDRKPYIVYMGELPAATNKKLSDEHHNLLSETIGDEEMAKEVRIHSYGRSLNGFVARLLPHEASKLAEKENVVSVFPSTVRKLHTTRSWDFLGMPKHVKRDPKVESNLIVGLLDTGIFPDSPSFNDKGYGPPPSRWKGKCAKGGNFTGCNRKVIGATYYNLGKVPIKNLTPVDTDGHGTHTSSTAAGVPVPGANLYGIAEGTAQGGVPAARIAMYKVCWPVGCTDMDILAAFDDAIADGVDVISVSLGAPAQNFLEDTIAIGAYHAMRKGVLTSCSAGNEGPFTFTVENVAPWILTVAASTIDRQLTTAVKLGSGRHLSGISINTFSPRKQMYPLISGAQAANKSAKAFGNASSCDSGTLYGSKVKGKIVYCWENWGQDSTIRDLGGAGVILTTDSLTDTAFEYLIPASSVSTMDGMKIDQYINSTKTARAVIYKSTTVKMTAPVVASFSSRGPQTITRNILKPDVAAPGVSILAAYSTLVSMTDVIGDTRFVKYNILSGTSMSCPHVAAAATYVKSFHPTWSPAAIKSALMTTATPMKIKQSDAELGSGSGQINPTKAVDPGLVYDINQSSYIRFLCKEGYNSTTIRLLTGGEKLFNCSTIKPALGTDGLNYPSMHLLLKNPNSSINAVFYRTVTNMGSAKSVYKMTLESPKGLDVTVVPSTLSFEKVLEKKSFKVVLKGKFIEDSAWILSALLEWSDGSHSVRSPIVVVRFLSGWSP